MFTYTIVNVSGFVPSKSNVIPVSRETTPFVIVAAPIDAFPPVAYSYVTAPPGALGVATTVNRVPVVVSGLVTVPCPVDVLSGTSLVHPVICASETITNV